MLTWWTSAVNRCVPSCLAASRTRASACDTRARLCVRCVLCWSAFPLAPSLHRRRSPGFVRRFLRYYGGVRLLPSVRHRLRPFGPSRCGPHLPQGRPNDRSPSSRAESFHACVGSTTSRGRAGCSPWRARPCGLPHCPTGPIVPQAPLSHRPHCPTGSAPRMRILSRLNTQPACDPVNASPTPSRLPTHDSGPMWMANPSP